MLLFLTATSIPSVIAAELSPANSPATISAIPRVRFASTNYDFGPVLAGEPVKHVFAFTNTGARDLLVSRVVTGCGCTRVSDWTRLVKPGDTGVISVQLNTGGFVGAVEKTVEVDCNDTNQPVIPLQLKGTVRRAIEVRPVTAFLSLPPDAPFGEATVWITNCLDQPLFLSAPESTNRALAATLRTNLLGHHYALLVSNTVPLPAGTLTAAISLQTSLTNLPTLTLLAVANSAPTFTVAPNRIGLSPTPLTTGQVAYVSIINNGTNPVTLSHPVVSTEGVWVELREPKPGMEFTAVLCFPPGFQLSSGRRNTLSLQTSHPRCPLIELPLFPLANPTPPAPLLKRTPSEVVTAPLPLVFQREAIAKLQLDADQQVAISQLRDYFIEAIGGLSQDPADPAYLTRWEKAQRSSDSRLAGEIGRSGVIKLDQAVAPAEADAD